MNRYTFTQDNVKQAIDYLKSQEGDPPSFISDNPDSFTTQDNQLFYKSKIVVPLELRAELLRKIMYKDPGGPMGRDSLYYFVSPNFVGIPRRFILEFLKKQKIFQDVKPFPRSETHKRGGIRHRKLGVLETDLVHLRAGDAPFWLKEGSPDRYFVVVCCVMTGYTQVRLSVSKDPLDMVKHFKKIFPEFEKFFKIRTLRSDRGGEFRNQVVATWLKEQGIKQTFASLASMVENRNRLFQTAFFTRARTHKGKLFEAIKSAVATVNNTLNRKVGLTPLEAIGKTSLELRQLRRKKRHTQPGTSKGPLTFQKGDKVRALSLARKNKSIGYKSYKGQLWGPDILKVVRGKTVGSAHKYLLDSGTWRWADELQGVKGTDQTSGELPEALEYIQDESYFGKDDELYEPSEEEEEPEEPPKRKRKRKPKKPQKLKLKPQKLKLKPQKLKKLKKPQKPQPQKPQPQKPQPQKQEPVGRRSSRLRGKRQDYHQIQHRYDKLLS